MPEGKSFEYGSEATKEASEAAKEKFLGVLGELTKKTLSERPDLRESVNIKFEGKDVWLLYVPEAREPEKIPPEFRGEIMVTASVDIVEPIDEYRKRTHNYSIDKNGVLRSETRIIDSRDEERMRKEFAEAERGSDQERLEELREERLAQFGNILEAREEADESGMLKVTEGELQELISFLGRMAESRRKSERQ